MAELQVYHFGRHVFSFQLDKSLVRVGRSSSNDLVLGGETVSRQHLELRHKDQSWWIKDLSTSGTWMNAQRLESFQVLSDGNEITLSDWKLLFHSQNQSEAEVSDCSHLTKIESESSSESTKILEITDEGRRIRISKPTLVIEDAKAGTSHYHVRKRNIFIGSSENCDVVLQDPFVSKLHLEMRMSDRGFHVVDLNSRNGTFLNQSKIREVFLKSDQLIEIGESKIHICFEAVDSQEMAPSSEAKFCNLYGESSAMRQLFTQIKTIAPSEITVLIQGETGTGKELVARALHDSSDRRAKVFVAVNCAAIQQSLAESELFGHEKGAFTGADQRYKGVFEQADGGTLFLDEIGELTLELQAKILRVLEYQSLRRVGGTEEVRADIRLVAATHRDLAAMVANGTFREDLYYRLMIVPISVPPLRERKDDVAVLANVFRTQHQGDRELYFSPEALAKLEAHTWPGNVRELRNTVLRAITFATENEISADLIQILRMPIKTKSSSSSSNVSAAKDRDNLQPALERREERKKIERQQISQALEDASGDKIVAAQRLGMGRSTLFRKIKDLGL